MIACGQGPVDDSALGPVPDGGTADAPADLAEQAPMKSARPTTATAATLGNSHSRPASCHFSWLTVVVYAGRPDVSTVDRSMSRQELTYYHTLQSRGTAQLTRLSCGYTRGAPSALPPFGTPGRSTSASDSTPSRRIGSPPGDPQVHGPIAALQLAHTPAWTSAPACVLLAGRAPGLSGFIRGRP